MWMLRCRLMISDMEVGMRILCIWWSGGWHWRGHCEWTLKGQRVSVVVESAADCCQRQGGVAGGERRTASEGPQRHAKALVSACLEGLEGKPSPPV